MKMKVKNTVIKCISLILSLVFLFGQISYAAPEFRSRNLQYLATQSIFKPLTGREVKDIGMLQSYLLVQLKAGKVKAQDLNYEISETVDIVDGEKIVYSFGNKSLKDEKWLIPCSIGVRGYYCLLSTEGAAKAEISELTYYTKKEAREAGLDKLFRHGTRKEDKRIRVYVKHEFEQDEPIRRAIARGEGVGFVDIKNNIKNSATINGFLSLCAPKLKNDLVSFISNPITRILTIKEGLKKPHASNIGIYIPANGDTEVSCMHELFAKAGLKHSECTKLEQAFRAYRQDTSAFIPDQHIERALRQKIIDAEFVNLVEVEDRDYSQKFRALHTTLQKALVLMRSRYVSAEPGPVKALRRLYKLAKEFKITDDSQSYVSRRIMDNVFRRWDKALEMSGSYGRVQAEVDAEKNPSYLILNPEYVNYDLAVCEIANPYHRELVALNAGPGVNILDFLLSTDATEAHFVDILPLNKSELESTLKNWKYNSDFNAEYFSSRKYWRFANADLKGTNMETRIAQELEVMGVKKEDFISVTQTGYNNYPRIKFKWKHPKATKKKAYTITFIQGDITKPDKWPQELGDLLKPQAIDMYYQRAGESIPGSYASFMPRIGQAIKTGGYCITNDKDDTDDKSREYNPVEQLQNGGIQFTRGGGLTSLSIMKWEKAIHARRQTLSYGVSPYGWNMHIRRKLCDSEQEESDTSLALKPELVDWLLAQEALKGRYQDNPDKYYKVVLQIERIGGAIDLEELVFPRRIIDAQDKSLLARALISYLDSNGAVNSLTGVFIKVKDAYKDLDAKVQKDLVKAVKKEKEASFPAMEKFVNFGQDITIKVLEGKGITRPPFTKIVYGRKKGTPKGIAIGLDSGGTNTKLAIIRDGKRLPLKKDEISSFLPGVTTGKQICDNLLKFIAESIEKAGLSEKDIKVIGLSITGPVRDGKMTTPPNLLDGLVKIRLLKPLEKKNYKDNPDIRKLVELYKKDINKLNKASIEKIIKKSDSAKRAEVFKEDIAEFNKLEERLREEYGEGITITIINDGAAHGFNESVKRDLTEGIKAEGSIGTGFGHITIINGDVVTTKPQECGHLIMDVTKGAEQKRFCACGNPGCLEGLANAAAAVRLAKERGFDFQGEEPSAKAVGDAAADPKHPSHKIALSVWKTIGEEVGRAALVLNKLTDIDEFIIGGGVARGISGGLIVAYAREFREKNYPQINVKVSITELASPKLVELVNKANLDTEELIKQLVKLDYEKLAKETEIVYGAALGAAYYALSKDRQIKKQQLVDKEMEKIEKYLIRKKVRPRTSIPVERSPLPAVRRDITDKLTDYLKKHYPEALENTLSISGIDLLHELVEGRKVTYGPDIATMLYKGAMSTSNLEIVKRYLRVIGRKHEVNIIQILPTTSEAIKFWTLNSTQKAILITPEHGIIDATEYKGDVRTEKGLFIIGDKKVVEVVTRAFIRDLSSGGEITDSRYEPFKEAQSTFQTLCEIYKKFQDNPIGKEALRSLAYIYYTSLYLDYIKRSGKEYGAVEKFDTLRELIERSELNLVDAIKEAYPPVELDYTDNRHMLFFPLTGGMIAGEGQEFISPCTVNPKSMSDHHKVALRPEGQEEPILVQPFAHAYGVHDSLTDTKEGQILLREKNRVHHDLGHYPYAGFSLLPVTMPNGKIRLMVQVIQSTGHAHKPVRKGDVAGPGEFYEALHGSFLHVVWRDTGQKIRPSRFITDLNIFVQRAGEESSKIASLPGQGHGAIPLGGSMVFADLVSTETDHKVLSASRVGGAPISMAIDPVDGKMYIITNPNYVYITPDVNVGEVEPRNKVPMLKDAQKEQSFHDFAVTSAGEQANANYDISALNDNEMHALVAACAEIIKSEKLGEAPQGIDAFLDINGKDIRERYRNFKTAIKIAQPKGRPSMSTMTLYRLQGEQGPYLIIRTWAKNAYYFVHPLYMHRKPVKLNGYNIFLEMLHSLDRVGLVEVDKKATVTTAAPAIKIATAKPMSAGDFFKAVRRLKERGETLSFISICSVSPEVIEAGLRYAKEHGTLAFFQVTTNQLNATDKGYLKMTPQGYTDMVREIADKVNYTDTIFWGGDHIGPYIRSTKKTLPLDEAMEDTRENIESLLEAGANFIHVDTTVGRSKEDGSKETLTAKETARRTVRLIAHAEKFVEDTNGRVEAPVYEIGSDEPGSKELTTSEGLTEFLDSLKMQLSNAGLENVWTRIMFVVGNTGTTMRLSVDTDEDGNVIFDKLTKEPRFGPKQEGFSVKLARGLAKDAKGYALYPTQHYSDWMPVRQGKDISDSVVKVNVGPEFEVNGRLEAAFELEEKVNKKLEKQKRANEKPRYYESLVEEMDKPGNEYIWKKWGPTNEEVDRLVTTTLERRAKPSQPEFAKYEEGVATFGEKEINLVAAEIMKKEVEIFVPQAIFKGRDISEIKQMVRNKFGDTVRIYQRLGDLDNMINGKNATRASVLLSGNPQELGAGLKKLVTENPNLIKAKFLNVEIPNVSKITDSTELDSYYRRIFATMFLARIAKASDVEKGKETPIGMLLRYYLLAQIGDKTLVDEVIAGLVTKVSSIKRFFTNIAVIIKNILRYKPVKAFDKEELEHVTEILWAA